MAFSVLVGAICLCLAAVCVQVVQCKNWAMLVAGSDGWANYRHQADVCHAYHIVKNHGIAPENIVTMMYDDIAYNPSNPYPGNIINWPNGYNLYPGVVIDYKGKDVSPGVFAAVLTGDTARVQQLTGRAGKVIKGAPGDHLFIYFSDHGAPGVLVFPANRLMGVNDLYQILKTVSQKGMSKIVMYVEACKSGSMFSSLQSAYSNINVYATTAANPTQNSYACYYDGSRGIYLADEYSANWMANSETSDMATTTLQQQYQFTKQRTTNSEVMQYGDMSISGMSVAAFQAGTTNAAAASTMANVSRPNPSDDAVPATEATLVHVLEMQLSEEGDAGEESEIEDKIQELKEHQARVDKLFLDIVAEAAARNWVEGVANADTNQTYWTLRTTRTDITQWACYQHAVDALMYSCPNMNLTQNVYALDQLFVLVNLCEKKRPQSTMASTVKTASRLNPQLCARPKTCVDTSSAPQLTVAWVLYASVVVYFVM